MSHQTDACVTCGSVATAAELSFRNERYTDEASWSQTGDYITYLQCQDCYERLEASLREVAAGERGSGDRVMPHPGARSVRGMASCDFCAGALRPESVVVEVVPSERDRVGSWRFKVRGRMGSFRLCRMCAAWVRSQSYGRDGALASRGPDSTRGSWLFTSVLDAMANELSGPDTEVVRKSVMAMGGRFSEIATLNLQSVNPNTVAFFVGCSGTDRATRFVQSLPDKLRSRVVLVSRWDTQADLASGLAAGAGDFRTSPLSAQSVAGAIDRVAGPKGSRDKAGLLSLDDPSPRYGFPRQLLQVTPRKSGPAIAQAILLRASVRGYDSVGTLPGGELGVATYCEPHRVDEVRRRLEFVLGRDYQIMVRSTSSENHSEEAHETGHLVSVAGDVVGSGVAGLPDPGEAPDGFPTVLYIEDTLYSLRLMEDAFRLAGGLHLLTAASGTRGLDMAQRLKPDMVLLDLHLPDIQGEQVLQRLKADPATAGIPVIAITADATDSTRSRVLAGGAAAYLTKPINIRSLLDLVRQRLSAADKLSA